MLMMINRYILLIIVVLISHSPAVKSMEINDTVYAANQCNFKAKDLILPGALIAVGATGLLFTPMEDLNHSIQKDMVNLRGNHHRINLDEYLRYAPTALNITLSIIKNDSKYSITDRILIKATSIGTMYALTQGLKHTINKMRPDGSDNHSFPSGHTASVFLGAESLRMNHGNWWGVAGYTAATATAFLRLYNNRHWLGDVISGAGIGIISARIGYWLLPLEKRILGLDDKKKNKASMVVVPSFDVQSNSYGMTMTVLL